MKYRFGAVALVALALVFSTGAAIAQANDKPAHAAIASAHKLATDAGFEVLAEGGNAFDAAVAVAAALSVLEPQSSGIGGGGLFLLRRASDGKETMIDARAFAAGTGTCRQRTSVAASRSRRDRSPGDRGREGVFSLVTFSCTSKRK